MVWFYDTAGVAPYHWTYEQQQDDPPSFKFGMESFDTIDPIDKKYFDSVADEEDIVWTKDVRKFDYVRETFSSEHYRQKAPRAELGSSGTQFGYATLRKFRESVQHSPYNRRVFWLKDYDRGMPGESTNGYQDSGAPIEAVDPRKILPGIPSQYAERNMP